MNSNATSRDSQDDTDAKQCLASIKTLLQQTVTKADIWEFKAWVLGCTIGGLMGGMVLSTIAVAIIIRFIP